MAQALGVSFLLLLFSTMNIFNNDSPVVNEPP
jgi:hypothetical protein